MSDFSTPSTSIPPPPPASFTPSTVDTPGAGVHSAGLVRPFLFALGAAAAGGAAWFGVVVVTNRIWYYLAFLIGVAAALAAERGGRKPSKELGAVAGVATAIAMTASLYFIFRHMLSTELEDAQVPVWLGLRGAFELIKIGVKVEPLTGICVAASVAVAAWKGASQR